VTEPDEVWQMRRALGRRLAILRAGAGYSQREFAPCTGYSRSTLSDAELGRHKVARDFWERCQRALKVGPELADHFDRIESVAVAWREASRRAAQAARDPGVPDQLPGHPQSPAGGAGGIPGDIVTVQTCPNCRQRVAVISVLATP
jgi:transcriptional regulator with XRE-family HTH domain